MESTGKPMNLYQINDKYLQLLNSLEVSEDTGEIINGELLKEIEDEREVKALSYAKLIRMLGAQSKEIMAEKKRLDAMRSGIESKISWLKNTLETVVQPGEKIKDMHASIYWMKTDTLQVSSIDNVPEEFLKYTVEPDKDGLKRALKAGEFINGVDLIEKQKIIVK